MTNIESKLLEQKEQVYQAADSMNPAALTHLAELNRLSEKAARQFRQVVREALEYVEALGLRPELFYLEDDQNVQVTMEQDCLHIGMEGILPFAVKGSVCYLHEKLEAALERFVDRHGLTPPIFPDKCAVVFVHHYDGQGHRYRNRQLCDFDNLEHRALMNVLTRYCSWDDGPGNIITMDRLQVSDRDCCEILVMPVRRFKEYVMSEEVSK